MGSPLGLRSAAIGGAGDVDYYSFTASAGSVVFFSTDGDPERDGAGTDLVVEVRNSADVVLALGGFGLYPGSLADPAAEGANFIIPADGEYFLRVRHLLR